MAPAVAVVGSLMDDGREGAALVVAVGRELDSTVARAFGGASGELVRFHRLPRRGARRRATSRVAWSCSWSCRSLAISAWAAWRTERALAAPAVPGFWSMFPTMRWTIRA